jgi:nucleoside-diphosphate-sugar epimerase
VAAVDFNGIHKLAAESYHRLLTETGGLDAIALRLTNIYGPRMALNLPCQGFLGTFVRRSLTGQALEIFGDGSQLRDPLYVDDAVEALLLAGAVRHPQSRTYNVGGPEPLALRDIAGVIAAAGGKSEIFLKPFPAHLVNIDIGSYWTDSSLIRAELGWKPGTGFTEGVRRTIEYFRLHLAQYLDPQGLQPVCSLAIRVGQSVTPVHAATNA